MIKIAGHSIDQTPMPYEMWNFWKKNALDLTNWAEVADNVALIATSSADAERGFSIYDGCVNDQQKSSKEDKSEATVMIRHNETKRRLETKAGRDRLNEFRALVGRSREIDKAGDNVDDEDDQM